MSAFILHFSGAEKACKCAIWSLVTNQMQDEMQDEMAGLSTRRFIYFLKSSLTHRSSNVITYSGGVDTSPSQF